ncbi:MAG TPA: DUF937 domain-containing protein [Rhizobiaceae bacterium]
MNLFDMLANAQDGQGMDQLARQFGLSQQQAQAAVEALLPAFSQGLKRNASDPYGVGSFLNAVMSGNHAKYFDDAQSAFSPQGMAEGNGILGHLFGSKDLSRAVAAQAAQATGLSQQILQQMLPVIASMVMGGLSKQSTGQFGGGQAFGGQAYPGQAAPGFGGSGNPLQEIIEQMMRQGGAMGGGGTGQPQQRQAPPDQQGQAADPFDNPFGKMLKDMFGGGAGQAGQPQRQGRAGDTQPGGSQNPFGDNPLGKIFDEMLKGGQGGGMQQPQERRTEPAPEDAQAGPSQNPFGDNPLGKMFEEMLRGAQGTPRQPVPDQQNADQGGGQGSQKNPYDDVFGEMFETGRKQRDEYEKNIGSIFDQFTKGMDRYR